jgi:hypothetical protein
MDELDPLSSPSLSSSLDDVFYILKKTLYRLVSTSNVETVSQTVKDIRLIVERDVADVWRKRLEHVFNQRDAGTGSGLSVGGITTGAAGSAANAVLGGLSAAGVGTGALAAGASVVGGGRAREEEKERRESEMRATFIVSAYRLTIWSRWEVLADDASSRRSTSIIWTLRPITLFAW